MEKKNSRDVLKGDILGTIQKIVMLWFFNPPPLNSGSLGDILAILPLVPVETPTPLKTQRLNENIFILSSFFLRNFLKKFRGKFKIKAIQGQSYNRFFL